MHATPTRQGITLIEMLVSLILLMLVTSVASLAARRSIGTLTAVTSVEARGGALSDALQTLSRHVTNSEPLWNDLRIVRDSVLELHHTIGFTTLCRHRADTLVVSAANDDAPWGAVLSRAVTSDDEVRVWDERVQRWSRHAVHAVSSASGACGDSVNPRFGMASQRVILSDTLAAIAPGAPIRVLQRERWSLVRGGDGLWALSLATWSAATGTFSTPQPLVAPLASPTDGGGPGFVVRAVDAAGLTLADSALLRARSVVATLRGAPHARFGAPSDSVRINVGAH